jgi:hypothetical protein
MDLSTFFERCSDQLKNLVAKYVDSLAWENRPEHWFSYRTADSSSSQRRAWFNLKEFPESAATHVALHLDMAQNVVHEFVGT